MNPYLILGVVFAVGVAGAGGLYKGHKLGKAEVQQQWDKEKAEQYAAYAKAQEEARKKEQELQANADQLRREKDEEIRDIAAKSAALASKLRDRKDRPTQTSSLSSTSQSCGGASGKELARGDGEFLAGYAADAARLQVSLETCIKQYEALRK
jgi:uncharacterized membrane protein